MEITNRLQLGIVVLLAQALAGCGADFGRDLVLPVPVPTAPSSPTPPAFVAPVPEPWPPAVFTPNVTLSGVVFEIVQDREVPIEGAWVYCEPCTEETHAGMYTDNKGFYTFKGAWETKLPISVFKKGYQDPRGTGLADGYVRREVTLNGDTRFNIQLARN